MTTSVSDRYWLCNRLLSGDLQRHEPLVGQALQLFVMETQVHYGTNRTVKLKRLWQGMLMLPESLESIQLNELIQVLN